MKKLVICLVVVMTMCCGCVRIPHVERNETTSRLEEGDKNTMNELNSRQIEICEEMGLPTEYDLLEQHQQESIMRIETLLQYLDTKYNKTFKYLGYSKKSVLEKEWLEAYSDDLNMYKTTVLYVNDDGSYEDNYVEVLVAAEIESELNAFVVNNIDVATKIFAGSCYTENKDINTISDQNINGSWISLTVVFEGDLSKEEIESKCNVIISWAKERGISGSLKVFVLEKSDFSNVTMENYEHIKINAGVDVAYKTDF